MTAAVAWELRDGVVRVVEEGERAGAERWGLGPSPAGLPVESEPFDWDVGDSLANAFDCAVPIV